MTTDEQLQKDVTDELFWDPRVDSDAIAVSVVAGMVTLRGTVGSPREKHEARKAAERLFGVLGVTNDLDVRLLDEDRREDAELRGDVLRAFTLNSVVPPTADAHVKDGFVTLTGSASWQFERDEAEFVAANVPGVTGVHDEIGLRGARPEEYDVRHAIRKAFRRNAKLDADSIRVETTNGTVSLTGTVSSWSEHDAAVAAAWAAPGVAHVHDHVTVRY
jgi:osmotically-inducible protein OsmY